MTIKEVFIVGAGLMGSGIAQVIAQAGINVKLNDVNDEALTKGMKTISWSVDKFIEKGTLSEDHNTILNRIQTTKNISDAGQADLAIEAVFENLKVKQEIFQKFDTFCKPNALLATNTSAIPITEMGAVTNKPDKVIGLHFFSPVPMMPVVELVKGISTSEESMEMAVSFVKKIGKEPIRVESDIPGFLMNRINLVSYVEAIQLLEKGIGTVQDIDKGVRLAFGRRMGPFETGDMVGLDVSFGALTAIYQETQDNRYYPPQLLRRKVKAGQLGRKTGKGWYEYEGNKKA
ncbi:MAG: 3-hydroxyacyl-CoA dehydrogenase family protein [Deltaproteobacteria bacterium]|uniref:3-hydroxyacyl-CoA dehydrogenase family protein n=1 Tax=Desulfobacula sp. TaxID=2593537 RepID=UPI00198DDBEE|nr:3-hydroxyacyl-CoA dehydrogenase family protein [Candidatus Desulfobacula maris]MBL6994807.1 3-hydroxyacyl-CoA dehydrogenase family protein [Desulfobacula sp.]